MKRLVLLVAAVCGGLLVAQSIDADQSRNPSLPPVAESLEVGSLVAGDVHRIDRPGVYGLATPPSGSQYAIIGNNLVRVGTHDDRIQAIIRASVRPVNEAALK